MFTITINRWQSTYKIFNTRHSGTKWQSIFYSHSMHCFLPFHSPRAHHVTCNNCLQIMACSCVIPSKCILWQIILCSCVTVTLPLCENGRSLPCTARDQFKCEKHLMIEWKTITELGYRKVSQFISVCLPKLNWSAWHWQITIFYWTSSNHKYVWLQLWQI